MASTKYIVWFGIDDKETRKKIKFNQVWVSSKDIQNGVKKAKKLCSHLSFEPHILGISLFENLIPYGQKSNFANNTFH